MDNRNVEIAFRKEHFVHDKFVVLISRGSAATHLRYGGQYNVDNGFVANFILFLVVKKSEDQ